MLRESRRRVLRPRGVHLQRTTRLTDLKTQTCHDDSCRKRTSVCELQRSIDFAGGSMGNTFWWLQAHNCAVPLPPGRRNRLYSWGGERDLMCTIARKIKI